MTYLRFEFCYSKTFLLFQYESLSWKEPNSSLNSKNIHGSCRIWQPIAMKNFHSSIGKSIVHTILIRILFEHSSEEIVRVYFGIPLKIHLLDLSFINQWLYIAARSNWLRSVKGKSIFECAVAQSSPIIQIVRTQVSRKILSLLITLRMIGDDRKLTSS